MILTILGVTLLVIWTVYQFERIDFKQAMISFCIIMVLSIIIGCLGFADQTIVHTINGLLVFIGPILAVVGVYFAVEWIKSE